MNEAREEYLKEFNVSESMATFISEKYSVFMSYVNTCLSGEGMIGKN